MKHFAHVIPPEDTRRHVITDSRRCWCRPVLQEGVVIHHCPDDDALHARAKKMAMDGFGAEDIQVECGLERDEAWRLVKQWGGKQ